MPSLDFDQEKASFREYYNDKRQLFENAVTSYQNLLTLLLADHDTFPAPKVTGRMKEREECINKFVRKYKTRCENKQYLRQFLAKRSATLYLAVKSAIQPPDVRGEIAIQDFGEGIE